ncbi:hypothetical protein ACFQZN_07360 [Mucilaginibacter boryungensis]|uniref:Uncharacterized protein n=2 Tax=Mucilaginibacter boryungensis TaxID=768480 RepID=A0ABR9XHC3_9SPHI|nr:hypothetical protein [Mucilaginibacter boryungensis]MBE9666794.1 hypothetical protein [Mucilaginibacter boryungensis]
MYLTYKNENMNHIMVCAEFPGTTDEQANEIYAILNQRNWTRITSQDEEFNNIWYGTFNRQMLEKDCREIATRNFMEAAKKYCSEVQLTILWGANKPTSQGFTLIS